MSSSLHQVLAFAEGRLTRDEWLFWWESHAADVAADYGRAVYLQLKFKPMEGARALLDAQGIPYVRDTGQCERCGARLFQAIPGQTTVQEIIAFARIAKFPSAEQIAEDGWIHPGIYCPNACIAVMHNYYNPGPTEPLLVAAKEREFDTVRKLLDQGADVNVADGHGKTALVWTCGWQHLPTVRLLLDRGADIHKAPSLRQSAIMVAAGGNFKEGVYLLLDYGADIQLALWEAAGSGYNTLVRPLLERGADMNAVCFDYTVLMKAIAHNQSETIHLLLKAGTDVNQQVPTTGRTALMRAVEQDHAGMVRLLLARGADRNARDAKGRTALDIAEHGLKHAMVDLLREGEPV